MKNVLNALDAMLEAYRKKERDFPSYDELAGLLKAPAILVSADPAENAAIARDAQAIVAAEVAALPEDNAWKQFCGRVNRPAATAPQVVADERAAFEEWAKAEGLIQESFGIRSTNSMCDVAQKAWSAGRAALVAAQVQAQEPSFKEVGSFLYVGVEYVATSSDDPRGIKLYRPTVAPVQPVAVPDGMSNKVRAFIDSVIEIGFEGDDVDGAAILQWAEDAGLIEARTMTEPCSEGQNCRCATDNDFPLTCYQKTYRRAAPAAQPSPVAVPYEELKEIIEALRRDASGGFNATVFELDRAAEILESLIAAPAAQGDAKDAERYQWLRNKSLNFSEIGSSTPYVIVGQSMEPLDGKKLDAKVDAAIAAKAAS